MKRALLAAGLLACASCASAIGIPNDTASFCSTHTGHTYCEDFDLGDPISRMSFHASNGGAKLSIAPSNDSPPNLADMVSPALGPGEQSLAGYDQEFDGNGFGKLHIEADLRLVTHGAGFKGVIVGILLISDKQGGCIGVALTEQGVSAFTAPSPDACGSLVGGGTHPDAGVHVGMMGSPLGGLPPLDQWVHVVAVVTPSASHDGSGTFTFDVVGAPTGSSPLPLGPGTVTPTGTPLVGFSASGLPTSAACEVQYDNVTIDLAQP